MASGASLRGAAGIRRKLRTFAEKHFDEVGRALTIETEVEAKEVRRRTPVDTGELRASIYVERAERDGKRIFSRIVAGGVSAPYAIYVHEDLDAIHKVGQAKFIESVLLESRPYMAARVARRIELYRALA